jgi:hypothetical protein
MTDRERRRAVYDKTNGRCHLCWVRLAFVNYNSPGSRTAWHVDHSIPRARGGTDHLNNLFPACIDCNSYKGTITSRTARGVYGLTRAPRSIAAQERLRARHARNGAAAGGVAGFVVAGPPGALVGAAIGAVIGGSGDKK